MSEPLDLPRGYRLLQRYVVEGRVASGGMATIYRAHDERLERPVCVKLLRTTLEGSGSTAGNKIFHATYQHFHKEALALSRLKHPNTLTIFDFGYLEESGRPFQISEYLEGGTLDERVRREGPWSPLDCSALLERVASAVAEAHALGIIHRDIKPSNIIFDVVGGTLFPKLADFGIAHGDLLPAQPIPNTEGSVSSVALFSPRWAAPEQLSGAPEGPFTDVYALAITLHYALVGRPLFEGRDVRHTFKDRVDGDELVARLLAQQELSRALTELLGAALSVDPKRRPPSAAAFASAFSHAAASAPSPARAASVADVEAMIGPSLEPHLIEDRADLTLPLEEGQRVRATFLPSAGGEHSFRLHLKGLTCLLKAEGGRPTPALHLDGDGIVELVSTRLTTLGRIGVSFGAPHPAGRRYRLAGGSTLLPIEHAQESVALYFGPKSEGVLLYRQR